MNIAIFGTSGIVGKAIVKEALEKGHQVTVLTRDAKKFPTDHNHLRIIEGDVTDRHVIHRVLENQNAVIQTLCIGGKGDGKGVKFTITAADMATFFIEQLDSKQFLKKMPTISN